MTKLQARDSNKRSHVHVLGTSYCLHRQLCSCCSGDHWKRTSRKFIFRPMMCAAMSVRCFCVWLYTVHGAMAASSAARQKPRATPGLLRDCPMLPGSSAALRTPRNANDSSTTPVECSRVATRWIGTHTGRNSLLTAAARRS